MHRIGLASLMLSLALASGCHVSCCSKRVSEKNCPTDIRKTHQWCFGEDALFRFPSGPNADFYGHKPTCWREWPTSGSQWRDIHCGPLLPPMAPAAVPIVPVMVPVDGPLVAAPSVVGSAPSKSENAEPDAPKVATTSEPAPAASTKTPTDEVQPTKEPNELPQASDGISKIPSAAKQELPQPAAAPTIQTQPQAIPPKGWRPMASDESPSALEFQPWSALGPVPPPPATAPTSGWIVVEESDAAASERSKQAVVAHSPVASCTDAAAKPAEPPGSEAAESATSEVIIEDRAEGTWQRALSKPVRKAPAFSAPELLPPKPSIEAATSAALQRFITIEQPAADEN